MSDVRLLARRTSLKLDDLANLRMFAKGLPLEVSRVVHHYRMSGPETFAQWMRAATAKELDENAMHFWEKTSTT